MVVIASGDHWLVVEKPAGMSIHNDPGRDLCSLVLAAVRKATVPAMAPDVSGIHAVHRLDRDTSGIVLLAVDGATRAFFGAQFAARTVHKRYLALVHGTLPVDGRWTEWNWPLAEGAGGRRDPMGRGKRMACATRWRVLDTSAHYSLIECEPLSGRQHQIRRHARLAGHAVVGDRRYGSARALAFLARYCQFNRLALHAHLLTLQVPGGTQAVAMTSAGLPDTMGRLFAADQPQGNDTCGTMPP
ncbi:hypothetical protein JCM12296A_00820 [Desulfosarcina cetonica]